MVECFVWLYFFKTDGRISTHVSSLMSNPSNLWWIICLMVCTILSAKGGGVDVIICLILCGCINLINWVEFHEPSLSWDMSPGTPICSKTSLKARIDSSGFWSLIGTAWHMLVKLSAATTKHTYTHHSLQQSVWNQRYTFATLAMVRLLHSY